MGQVHGCYPTISCLELKKNIDDNEKIILLNTLDENKQHYLIKNTLSIQEEVKTINNYLNKDKNIFIVIYGLDYRDLSIIKKYNQLKKIGFKNVSIYFGGIFEWSLLNITYDECSFPLTNTIINPIELLY